MIEINKHLKKGKCMIFLMKTSNKEAKKFMLFPLVPNNPDYHNVRLRGTNFMPLVRKAQFTHQQKYRRSDNVQSVLIGR